jgi:hypothetical protein
MIREDNEALPGTTVIDELDSKSLVNASTTLVITITVSTKVNAVKAHIEAANARRDAATINHVSKITAVNTHNVHSRQRR